MIYATRTLVGVTVLIILLTASVARADTLTFSGAEDMSVEAVDSSGASVTYDVTAQDASSTPFAVTCVPPSGSLFPIGTTTVQCEAADAESATSTASFDVGVFIVATSSETHLDIEGDVNVPAACDIIDTDGASHHYEAVSTSTYIGICALAAAKDASVISDFQATNFSFGLFVTSVGGVAADPSSQFWSLFQNGDFPSVGLTDLPIAAGDTIELKLQDFSGNNVGDHLTLHIDTLIATSTTAATSTPDITDPDEDTSEEDDGGGGGGSDPFDINDALTYLASKQNADGSYASDMITDWVAIGLASVKSSTALSKIKTYMQTASQEISSVTDAERHAMALQALGINPYTGTSVDYIAPIVAAFDGTQIGDSGLDNDDIFALFPLLHAGYSSKDVIIQKTAAFILGKQRPNGSWDESPDMTAAAIDALGPLFDVPGVNASLGKAVGYLMSQQEDDGGWDSIDSTSWVQTAINGILAAHTPGFDSESDFASGNGNLPTEALADGQESDGGVRPIADTESNRTWSTGYALLAASGKDWSFLLKNFSKPTQTTTPTNNGGGGGTVAGASTSTVASIATTTIQIATSTLTGLVAIGTSTPTLYEVKKETAPKPIAKLTSQTTLASDDETSPTTPETQPETSVESQTAAAAEGGGFFIRVWHGITSFFGWLFGLL